MIKQVGKFVGRSTDRQMYGIYEYQGFIPTGTKDGGKDWIPGIRHFELQDGSKVSRIDERTFKVVATGLILHRLR